MRYRVAVSEHSSLFSTEVACKYTLLKLERLDELSHEAGALLLLAYLWFVMDRIDESRTAVNRALKLCNRMNEHPFFILGGHLDSYFASEKNVSLSLGQIESAIHRIEIFALLSDIAIYDNAHDDAAALSNKAFESALVAKWQDTYIDALIAQGKAAFVNDEFTRSRP
jgi:hypothetical protein